MEIQLKLILNIELKFLVDFLKKIEPKVLVDFLKLILALVGTLLLIID